MRFKHENRIPGQQRVISKFLFIPKRIGDETRWLEKATIRQTLNLMRGDAESGGRWCEWIDTEWID